MQRLAGLDVLAAFVQVALDHHAGDAGVTVGDLAGHVLGHVDLAAVLLAAVGVREVDHHLFAQAVLRQQLAGSIHVGGAVVGGLAAAQDDVAVGVAVGLEDGGHAHLGDAHEGVRGLGCQNGVGCHFHAAVGAVLEAHGAGQATGQLAVALAFGGACADGAPADEFADELGREQIEEFGGNGHAELQHVQQQPAGHFQSLVDGVAVVHVRVIDVALPADGGAGLLEVDAHQDEQVVGEGIGLCLELAGVVHGLRVVMDGAGTDNDQQAIVLAGEDAADRRTAVLDQLGGGVGGGQPFLQQGRGDEGTYCLHAGVVHPAGAAGVERGGRACCGGHGLEALDVVLLPVYCSAAAIARLEGCEEGLTLGGGDSGAWRPGKALARGAKEGLGRP